MRLLIIGSDKVYSIENYYYKYMLKFGVTVERFTAQSIFYDYYAQGGILKKLWFKVGFSSIFKEINTLFRTSVERFQPTVILIFKGMEIFPESLHWAKSRGIFLVNYNPDNPFIFSGKGSGNRNITNSFSLYDLHLTYNQEVKNKIQMEYNIPCRILPFGFEVDVELYETCESQTEIVKVCFLGNPDKERAAFITALANEGVEMDVYGNNWEKWVRQANIKIYEPVYGGELFKTLRKYRVQLNLMRVHNLNSHNMRSFEVPGVGGIMVAPKTSEHELYFEDKKEAFYYRSVKDCSRIIREVLSLSSLEANEIRQNARRRSIASAYSYKDRTIQLLKELQKF